MEHAEAHELLADLVLEPSRLARFETDTDPTSAAIRAHVKGCSRCTAYLADRRLTWDAMGAARDPAGHLRGTEEAGSTAIRPPDRLRAQTMAAIRAEGAGNASDRTDAAARTDATAGTDAPSAQGSPDKVKESAVISFASAVRSRTHWRGLLAAAAVVVAVVAGTVAVQSQIAAQQADSDVTTLSSNTATLNRILESPHKVVTLQAADGSAGGVLAWNRAEFIVLTSTLQAPGPGQVYRCWIQQNGSRTVIGSLYFAGSSGSWSGSMTAWQWGFEPGTQFGVSLYSQNGSAVEPVLVASF